MDFQKRIDSLSTATKKINFGFAAFSPAAFSVSSIIRSSFSWVEVGWEVPSPSQPNKMELRVSLILCWSGVLRQTTDLLCNSTCIGPIACPTNFSSSESDS